VGISPHHPIQKEGEKTMENIMKWLVASMINAIDCDFLSEIIFGEYEPDEEVIAYLNDYFTSYADMTARIGDKIYLYISRNLTVGKGLDKAYIVDALGEIDWAAVAEGVIQRWLDTSEELYTNCKWFN
jgi:hypothetical protein